MEKSDPKSIQNILALTPVQGGMLFHYLQDPGSKLYIEQLSLEIAGEIDVRHFEEAWNVVVETNEMLRTVFRWEKLDKPFQIILKEHKCNVVFHDLSDKDDNGKKPALEKIRKKDRCEDFDLHLVPFRVILCKLAEKQYEIIISNHHILYDGWSNGLILKEFFNVYHELCRNGQVLKLPAKPSFKEFIKWTQSQDRNKQEKFWREYLAGVEASTELPIKIKTAKAVETGTGNYSITLEVDISSKLNVYVKNRRITLAPVFYAAWGILLQKYCNCEDVIFGTTVSGRPGDIKGIEEMVGLFINTIPLRIQTAPDEKIRDVVVQTDQMLREREAFENTALVDIGSYSNLSGSGSLFDTILALENYPLDNGLVPKDCLLSIASYAMVETTHYDLAVGIVPANEIEISFNYKQELFEKETITNLAGHFKGIIQAIIEKPGTELSRLEIIASEEKNRILYEFNDTKAEFPADKTIHQLFAEQASKTPDHIALVGQVGPVRPVQITYRQLNEHSNQLAERLIEKGVQPDSIVGIMMARSIEMVIGIFGILKAGGAYLPIDPEYPKERSDYMLKDSNAKILINKSEIRISKFETNTNEQNPNDQNKNQPFENSSNLAYLIYTSGSTGRPKGVAVEHSQLVNFIYHMYHRYDREVGVHDRCLGTTNIMFDVSIWEFFLPLTFGARLVLLSGQNRFDVFALVTVIIREKITLIYLPPALLEGVCEHLKTSIGRSRVSLNKMLVGVEPIRDGVLAEYTKLNPNIKIINGYGPTETTICASSYNYYSHEPEGEIVPIGTPLSNNQIVLLDTAGHITPGGTAGEICISGAGVSRGYLNNPELTAERYTPHPYYHRKRMYRTGDMAHWLPDGNMRFIGRKDHQVKLRGYRVELGEIENQLLNHTFIKNAVVIAWENENKEKYLCAYIVPRSAGACDVSLLKEYLQQRLPGYMVPAYFVSLTEIPLTAAGKIDRRALPQPEIVSKASYTAPRNELEEKLAAIWAGILGTEKQRIGIDFNFFEIGGHSLKAINMAEKIHKELNLEASVGKIFALPTIRELSTYLSTLSYQEEKKFTAIEAVELKEYYNTSSAQKRLFILARVETDSINYNMHDVFELTGELNKGRLEKCFMGLIARHESLRTSFHLIADEPVQKISAAVDVEFSIEYYDVTSGEPGNYEAVHDINDRFLRPFDLSSAPLLRVGLIKIAEHKHILMVGMHHIISDGISVNLFITDFIALYHGQDLAPLRLQYKDFSRWQHREKEKDNARIQAQYWLKEFAGDVPRIAIPYDFPRPAVQGFTGEKYRLVVEGAETNALKKRAREENVTLFMLLMAVYDVMLWKISGTDDIVVGTPVAGRRHADLESIMGMFVNTLALKTQINPEKEKCFGEFLEQVKQKTLAAFENQDYQFEDLVEAVMPTRDLGRNPIFDVLFVLQNMNTSAIEIPGLKITPFPFETHIAPFDMYLMAEEQGDALYFTVGYCTKLFKEDTIRRFMGYFTKTLTAATAEPGTNLALTEIEILSVEEKQQLLVEFNNTGAAYAGYPENLTIHEWFEQQVERTPDLIASGGQGAFLKNRPLDPQKTFYCLTYRELNREANRLAHRLRQKGVGRDTIVAAMMPRSIEMVVGLLGILKAGGAYLPVNPGYPAQRILSILEDSGGRYLLTDNQTSRDLPFTVLRGMNARDVSPVVTQRRAQVKDFDRLPHPDRTLIDYRKYHRFIGIAPAKYTVNIQATRGCPYGCAYCHKIWPKTHVVRSAENIFAEIRACYDAGVKRFVFIDDIFNLRKENSARLFETIIKHNYNVQFFFPNGLRGDILTTDFIDLMIEAGTINIALALETASPRLQKLIAKQLNLEKFAENVHYITKKHPQVILEMEMMIGFPTETEAEAMMTLELLKRFKWVHFPNLHILKIYPNTDMGRLALENGVSKESIARSAGLAFHELPETLPFSKRFAGEFQAQLLNDYFLSKERLTHVLRHQVKILSEDELVQKYDSYLPATIKSFQDILTNVGISSEELGPIELLPGDRMVMAASDFNEKIKAYYPSRISSTAKTFRVLLMDLSQWFRSESGAVLYDVGAEPLGLMYLATYLHEQLGAAVEVKILKSRIDFDSYAELEQEVSSFKPHLIGLRTLSLYKEFFHRTVSMLKHWGITAPIITGGPYATSDYRQLLQDYNVDLVVLGEGELTTAQLVKEMMAHHNQLPAEEILKNIPGLAYIREQDKAASLSAVSRGEVLLTDDMSCHMSRQADHFSAENPKNINQPGDLLYLISTSGSTGLPKSVMLEHRTLVNLMGYQFESTGIDFSRVLQFAAIGFDVSLQELFSALLSGGTVYLPDNDMRSDVPRLLAFIANNRITSLFLPPAFLKFIFSEPAYFREFPRSVQHIITAGEQLIVNEPLRQLLKERGVYLHNHYGPSETHVVTALTIDPTGDIPQFPGIGKPVANTGIYILDKYGHPQPVGVIGELCIGGVQVGRGYLNRLALTARKFNKDLWDYQDNQDEKNKSFAGVKGELFQKLPLVFYKTGDKARWLPDGNIEFLGRLDNQVKIRGFRIETGEIENRLLTHHDIKDAVAVTREDDSGELYLAAYYVSQSRLMVPGLREFLLNVLPDYMVPAYFVQLERIPLTPTGKVDRRALPAPESTGGTSYVTPRNRLEEKLAEIWCAVLGIDSLPGAVGIDENFFQSGGHSLKATSLASRIHKEFKIKIPLGEIFKNPTIRGLFDYINDHINAAVGERYTWIAGAEKKEYYVLSSAQKRLYFLQQMDKAGTAYNMSSGWILEGRLDRDRLEQSLAELMQRHESFRTYFEIVAGEPVQRIKNIKNKSFAELFQKRLPEGPPEAIIKSFIRPFDLAQAPLLRVGLVELEENRHLLMVDMHHIISDGISVEILVHEFTVLYAAGELPAINLHYKDYAEWQNREKGSESLLKQKEYWKNELAGEIPVLELPTDYGRPAVRSFEGNSLKFEIGSKSTGALKSLALGAGATLYMALMALYSIFLAKVSGGKDIVIGSPVAGRRHADLERIIGMFVNTLALRNYPVGEKTFSEFLGEVREKTLTAFENQDYQYEDLVEEIKAIRDAGRNPLFDTLFVLQNAGQQAIEIPGLKIKLYEHEYLVSKFDLSLIAVEGEDKLLFTFEYSAKLFKPEAIERFSVYFKNIVSGVVNNKKQKISDFEIITEEEKKRILFDFNDTGAEYPANKTIYQLFEEQAEKAPDSIALVGADLRVCPNFSVSLTYHQLHERANHLSEVLIEKGILADEIVAIMMKRSIDLIIGIMGILKSGGAYLPIDPEYPQERIAYMLRDSNAKILINKSEIRISKFETNPNEQNPNDQNKNQPFGAAFVLNFENLNFDIVSNFDIRISNFNSSNLAYIIYTSGSTGHPKGVAVEHAQLVNFIYHMYNRYDRDIGIHDQCLAVTNIVFDVSVWEFFLPLTFGARLVILPGQDIFNVFSLAEAIGRELITLIYLPPALLEDICEKLKTQHGRLSLNKMLVGVEPIRDEVLEEYIQLNPHMKIINGYGPTETTICASSFNYYSHSPEGQTVPIGVPLSNNQILLLDNANHIVPLGLPGEICISGVGVSRGYLNRPELTANKYTPHPYFNNKRMYRTGDLAQWRADGNIKFLGRIDQQVKIRGVRIELGEIESRLFGYTGITGCVVTTGERNPGEKYICAYFTAGKKLETSAIRDYLTQQLPAYMIPAYFMQLEKIPVTPNGKIDKKHLPVPEAKTGNRIVAPQNNREKIIATAWKETLELHDIGIDDNFFELGGNSLDIVKVHHQLKGNLTKDIPLMSMFRYPTIRALAAYLDKKTETDDAVANKKEIFDAIAKSKHKSKQAKERNKEIAATGLEIAVIGMAGRFPGARNVEEFWHNLKNGVESITFFSAKELEEAGCDPFQVRQPNYVKAMAFMQDSEYFDGSFFGYTPMEIEVTDPQIRIFHECAWAALEDAGYDPGVYPGRIGLYSGGESSSFWETLTKLSSLSESMDSFTLSNLNNKDYLSTRISYKFNLKGPAAAINTACSTSLVAIHFAVQGLLNGECEMALAGGVRVNLPGKTGYLYQEGMINSPDGHCRAFAAGAKGTVAGEGAGVVVLKPLEEATADGDNIYAVIKGSAINNDGIRKVGFHAPSIDGQSDVISAALHIAEVEPGSIGYIEAHGTGTELGDTVEIEALKLSFNSSREKSCAIGSVKTNIGHLGCAAGIAGFIKTVLVLKHGLIPPSLHFEKPNPKIDFENSPFYVNTQLKAWPETGFPARAGVSSFGIGGSNAHIVLETAPSVDMFSTLEAPDRPYQLLLLSARTPAVLEKMTQNLASYLKENSTVSLADMAYTLQAGRKRFPLRQKLLCADTAEAIAVLTGNSSSYTAQPADENRKVIFMFPGLGPQYVNMGIGLYKTEPFFREEMDYCFEILKPLGYDIKKIIYPTSEDRGSSKSNISELDNAQMAMFIFEYALAKLIMHWGIRPHAMIGYSFGEYVAACLAGVFSLEDILKVLAARGKLISRLPAGTMLSVPLPVDDVLPLMPDELSMGIDNGPSCVVSGPAAVVELFAKKMKEHKVLCSPFESPYAAHSQMLAPILAEFEKEVAKISLNSPQIPYISTVTGTWVTVNDARSPGYWVKQLSSTVYFVQGIRKILEESQPLFLEMGPGRDMSALVNREISEAGAKKVQQAISLVKHRGVQKGMTDEYYLLDKIGRLWLYGVNIDWQAFHADYPERKRYRLSLPSYPFERQRYWKIIDDYQAGKYFYLKGAPGNRQKNSEPADLVKNDQVSQAPESIWYPRPQLSTFYVAPQDDIQQTLVGIWQHLFGIEEIGIRDDFFELGGDSLKALNVLASVHKETNRHVPLNYFFDNPTIEQVAAYFEADEKKFISIQPLEKKEYYPMSSAQKRMYFFQQIDLESIAYNNVLANIIDGDIDTGKLSAVFEKLIARHEGLRTSFIEVNSQLVQRIHDSVEFEITGRDDLLIKNFIRPFDLTKAPLLRVGLLNQILIVDMHHIISDGTSLAVLIEEFMALYQGAELPALPLQYKDYAVWQDREKEGVLSRQRDFWLNEFAGEIPVLDLPYDYTRPVVRSFSGKTLTFEVGSEETLGLNRVASGQGATLYMTLLCLTGIFLTKLGGQETVVIGTPIAGRTHADLGRIIGMFVNTLAMKIEPVGEKTVLEFLDEVKEKALNAFTNQDYPYEELVEHLAVDRSSGRNPLFDTLFAMQNVPINAIAVPGLNLKPYPYEQGIAKFDLSFQCFENSDTLSFTLEYSTELFKDETAEKLAGYFKKILSSIVEKPTEKIASIELISQEEKEQVLLQFNDTTAAYPTDKTIHQLFAEQAAQTPDRIALVGHVGLVRPVRLVQLTYRHLNEQSDQVAGSLIEKGILADNIVGIMMARSVEMIIGIMGILKSGGAYLPIDPEYPQERIDFMLKDSGAKILLTVTECVFHHSSFIIHHSSYSSQLAYLIYTSGSTGKPKGVMIEHGSVVNLLLAMQDKYPFTPADTYLLKTSYIFDVSVTELFGWVMGGGQLAILEKDGEKDPQVISNWIEWHHVTHINFVPSMFSAFLDFWAGKNKGWLRSLKYIFLAGEVLLPEFVTKFRSLNTTIRLENIYGPTESSVYSSQYSLAGWSGSGNIPIGRPLPNIKLYIFDKDNRLQPPGIVGELAIAGVGLARGYLNRPELTADKFNKDLWNYLDKHDDRNKSFYRGLRGAVFSKIAPLIYHTGDLARWLANGNIEFLGRIDHQVKIRGFRIELGEIENRLLKHSRVKNAVVIVKEDAAGDKNLAAYIVSDIELPPTELREYLSKDLPDYMLPSYFVRLEQIPLTANGKINRPALHALPNPAFIPVKEFEGPGNDIEKKLANIWSNVLPLPPDGRIGIDDNFFQLGGHSLKATVLVSKIHKELNVKIPLMEIFKTPTIRGLAKYITGLTRDIFITIEPAEEKEYYPLSSAQKRMYFLQQFDLTAIGYNMPLILSLGKEIDQNKLESILWRLIDRHESLRTSFEGVNEEVVQKIHKTGDIRFALDFYKADKTTVKEIIKNYIKPFDLSRAPLIRSGLIAFPDGNFTWMVDMHHIISDGTSHTILMEDFTAEYLDKKLKPLRIQYKDFAIWQEHQFETSVIKAQMDYWVDLLAAEIPRLNLPVDYKRPEVFTFAGDSYEFVFSGPEAKKFKELVLQGGGTFYMNMLAALNVLFYKYTGQTDIITGTGIAGRRHDDLQGIVGMFINTLPMRNYPGGEKPYESFLKEVLTGCVKGFENQDVQFEDLVDNLTLERDASRNPVFDIMIMAQNFRNAGEGGGDSRPVLPTADENSVVGEYKNLISKFDMTFFVDERGDDIFINIEYYTGVFKPETIRRLAAHLKNVMIAIASDSFIKIKDIEMIADDEKKKVIYEFNDTSRDYPKDKTIHQLFEEQALETPDHIALVGAGPRVCPGPVQLTYRHLNEQSDQMAGLLIEKGVLADTIVGIMMERSIEQIIGILGILKSGGAYLPIDPEYPQERVDYMLKDSATKILLTAEYFFNSHHSSCIIPHANHSSHLAYLIYTSGTTGKPKGVMVEHGSIFNTIYWRKQEYNLNFDDRVLQLFSFAFDGFLASFFTPIVSGASVVQLNEDEIKDIFRIKEIIAAMGITCFICVPALFRSLLEISKAGEFSSLKIVSLAGEQVQPDLVEKCKQLNPLLEIVNEYGPTESSVEASIDRNMDPNAIITIGKPIANTGIYILDKDENLLPPGIAGQLTISGKGLARGYLNKPGLTADQFINFHHSRLYCTGDLGRWLPGGNIEFLGRIDQQVKIRGFRIELGEIENRLLGHPGITGCVVTLGTRKSGEKYICAYFTAETTLEISGIRDYLSGLLPSYMIPAYFMPLARIPITPNGKIDKKRLPAPEAKIDDRFVAPKSNCEKTIAALWKEVLELENIGIDDNFFELGGNSLDILKVNHQLKEQLEKDIPVMVMFRYPTVKTLAAYLDQDTDNLAANKKEIFEAIDKGKNKLKKRMEKRKMKDQ